MKRIITIILTVFALLMIASTLNQLKSENIPDSFIDEQSYCNSIDSLCYAYGYEIDADMYDLDNPESMENAAYNLLGDIFAEWKLNK